MKLSPRDLLRGSIPLSLLVVAAGRGQVAWRQAELFGRRSAHAMATDAARQRVVLFGGDVQGPAADTWEWDGVRWNQRFPAIVPRARHGHALSFDPARNRVLRFGGVDASFQLLNDIWEWAALLTGATLVVPLMPQAGSATVDLPVPATASLLGQRLYAQAFATDAAANAAGLVVSSGGAAVFGAR